MAYWWVNQGITYAAERSAGLLWAPQANQRGQVFSHWRAMTQCQPGDVIFHYARGLRAVSRVLAFPRSELRPRELPEKLWEAVGWAVDVEYVDLSSVVPLHELPVSLRRPFTSGPFDVRGAVKQGYLFSAGEIGKELLSTLASNLPVHFSAEAALPPAEAASGAKALLRQLAGEEIRTIAHDEANVILHVEDEHVIVATGKSPEGSPVEIAQVQRALDRLLADGELSISVESVGYRSAFIGAVLRTLPGVEASVMPCRLRLVRDQQEDADDVLPPQDPERDQQPYEGPLNIAISGRRRGEQRELRRYLFGAARSVRCAICGGTVPAQLAVAAHVKPRAACSDAERRDLQNVGMVACRFGCDDLFETGYISVGSDGLVVGAPSAKATGGVVTRVVALLEGRPCPAYTEKSAGYFAWHRNNRFMS